MIYRFKNNIWTIYKIILFVIVSLFIYISVLQWKDTYLRFTIENENRTALISKSTDGFLKQIEILFNILEYSLKSEDNLLEREHIAPLLRNLIDQNDALLSIVIFDPSGEVLISSLDDKFSSEIPNLSLNPLTKDSFIKTINTNEIILGRTYSLENYNLFSIPVRRRIVLDNGETYIITIAINATDTAFIDSKIISNSRDLILIVRELDRYPQIILSNNENIDKNELYYKEIPEKKISKSLNLTLSEIKQYENTTTFKAFSALDNMEYLISSRFINRYKLWVNYYMRIDKINSVIFKNIVIDLTILILIILTLYFIFKYIIYIENEKKEKLEYLAYHDPITGLYNFDYLYKEYINWSGNKENFSLLHIAVTNLRYVNDYYGHSAGNKYIKHIAKTISEISSEDMLLIKYDSCDFILLTDFTDNIARFTDDLLSNLDNIPLFENQDVKVESHIGISLSPLNGIEIDDLVNNANIAVEDAIKNNKKLSYFMNSMRDKYARNIKLEKEIDSAITNKEFYLVYQPQISCSGEISGVEALLRWNSSKYGFISPEEFIPLAEASGKMIELGNYVLDLATSEIANIYKITGKYFKLAINISVVQFVDKNFTNNLIQIINDNKIKPEYITLEITESVFIQDIDYIVQLLFKLKEFGFCISLDDFGTGFSSLSVLRKIPIDELKIDKSFIDDIDKDARAKEMVESIITISKNLKFKDVVAEGIETENQYNILNSYNCNTYQGYHFSKPLSFKNLIEYIER